MKRLPFNILCGVAFGCGVWMVATGWSNEAESEFTMIPAFSKAYFTKCHGVDKQKSDVRLDTLPAFPE